VFARRPSRLPTHFVAVFWYPLLNHLRDRFQNKQTVTFDFQTRNFDWKTKRKQQNNDIAFYSDRANFLYLLYSVRLGRIALLIQMFYCPGGIRWIRRIDKTNKGHCEKNTTKIIHIFRDIARDKKIIIIIIVLYTMLAGFYIRAYIILFSSRAGAIVGRRLGKGIAHTCTCDKKQNKTLSTDTTHTRRRYGMEARKTTCFLSLW